MVSEGTTNIAIRVTLIVLAAAVVIFLITYYSRTQHKSKQPEPKGVEKFNSVRQEEPHKPPPTSRVMEEAKKSVRFFEQSVAGAPQKMREQFAEEPVPSDPYSTEDYIAVNYDATTKPVTTPAFPQDTTKPEDLLPKDAANSKWAQVAPAGQGDVKNQNFLTAGFHMGKDTIGVARKNPNLTIRSEPPNPKMEVSPWNVSTIEPDDLRRGFEIR
jgi:hypothetical protein